MAEKDFVVKKGLQITSGDITINPGQKLTTSTNGNFALDIGGDVTVAIGGTEYARFDGSARTLSIGATSAIANSMFDVYGRIGISNETATPAQPADGKGLLYTKAGGGLYWRSYDQAENKLSGLSVSTASASGNGSLSIDTATGVLTFTPANVSGGGGASNIGALDDVLMDAANFTDGILIQPDTDTGAPSHGTLSSATGNIGIGKDTFSALTSGTYNVALGYVAG